MSLQVRILLILYDNDQIRKAVKVGSDNNNNELAIAFVGQVWNSKENAGIFYVDRKKQKWSMLWMATALNHSDLCEKAWGWMSADDQIKNIFDVFDSEERMNRIVRGNVALFADYVRRLLREVNRVQTNPVDSTRRPLLARFLRGAWNQDVSSGAVKVQFSVH